MVELSFARLYADSTEVLLDRLLSAKQQKQLLEQAREYFEGLAVAEARCTLARTADNGFLRWGGNKGLVIEAEIGDEFFQALISVSLFGEACVVSCYKQIDSELFAVNHSPEARKRALIDRLRSVEAVDYFFLLDKVVDEVKRFVIHQLKA